MGSELKCFWWSEEAREKNRDYKFHVISHEVPEESPAGGDGTRYYFYCGRDIESWEFGGLPMKRTFGTPREALDEGLEICGGCLVAMPKEEVRKLRQCS